MCNIWCSKMISVTQWPEMNSTIFVNQFSRNCKKYSWMWENNSKQRIFNFIVSNSLVEELGSLNSWELSKKFLGMNLQEHLTQASQLPEVVLLWLPSKVLFSESLNTHSMKKLTMELNFLGTLLKEIIS